MTINALKWIAFIFMVIDHIGYVFNLNIVFRILGRVAAPIYLFCFVEGYKHTKDKIRYKERLFYSALFMGLTNGILALIFNLNITPFMPNMFFTFLVMFQVLEDFEKGKVSPAILLVPLMEYDLIAFMTIFCFYLNDKCSFMKTNKVNNVPFFVILNGLLCIIQQNHIQMFMMFGLIPILFYNGKPGKKNKLFYILYPLHFYYLIFIYIILNNKF